jgi:hypothetical protein
MTVCRRPHRMLNLKRRETRIELTGETQIGRVEITHAAKK